MFSQTGVTFVQKIHAFMQIWRLLNMVAADVFFTQTPYVFLYMYNDISYLLGHVKGSVHTFLGQKRTMDHIVLHTYNEVYEIFVLQENISSIFNLNLSNDDSAYSNHLSNENPESNCAEREATQYVMYCYCIIHKKFKTSWGSDFNSF